MVRLQVELLLLGLFVLVVGGLLLLLVILVDEQYLVLGGERAAALVELRPLGCLAHFGKHGLVASYECLGVQVHLHAGDPGLAFVGVQVNWVGIIEHVVVVVVQFGNLLLVQIQVLQFLGHGIVRQFRLIYSRK